MIKLKETQNRVILNISVIPNQKKFEIKGFNKWNNSLKVSTKEKAQRGKANREIEQKLSKIFEKKTVIVAGHKSRNKKVLVQGKKNRIKKTLNELSL